MVSGLIEFSERSEQFLPYGWIDKIIGDQRELKEWGFLALLLFFVRAAYKGNGGWLAALARCSRYPLAVHGLWTLTLYAARLTARR